jgi:hypothetical protein
LPAFLVAREAPPEMIAMAQLDRVWMASFFAADAEPIGPDRLTSLAPSAIPCARLTVHPSLRIIRFADAWFDVWLARGALPQMEHDREPGADGRFVVLSRPRSRVRAMAAAAATYRFLETLQNDMPLLAACESALSEDGRFDLQAQLSAAFADGLITGCLAGESRP